jgi:membrane associated rhomboid family serine protease
MQNPRQLARLAAGKWSPAVVRENRPTASASSPWERGEAVRAALLYPVQPVVTFVLIAVNIGAFLLQRQSPQFENLLIASPIGILENQWWRLLTTAFLHAGTIGMPWHLAMNMMALYSLGRITEQLWGHARYLAIYVVGALGSTCLALISRLNPPIGASGAVCAIFASWAVWFFYNRQHLPPPLFFAWQRNFLVNVVLLTFISLFPGVSWEGHLGGAIAGFALALWFSFFQIQFGWQRSFQWVGVLLIPLVAVGLLIRTMQTSGQWITFRQSAEKEEMKIRSKNEAREFEEKYIPQIQSSIRQAKKVRLEDILEQNPTRRDDKEVEKAIVELSTVIDSLESAADKARQAGPYSTRLVEEAQKIGLKALEAQVAYLQLAKECLKKANNWTEKDEAKLQQQKEEMERADKEWQSMLR